jgi:hypothetical protein
MVWGHLANGMGSTEELAWDWHVLAYLPRCPMVLSVTVVIQYLKNRTRASHGSGASSVNIYESIAPYL